MRTMNRRDFIRIVVVGVLVVAATTLPSFAWSKKVTPNPSLVDKLQWVQESDARRIVAAYRDGRATPEEVLPALFSLLDPGNNGFSIIPRQVGRLRDFQLKKIPKEKIDGLDRLVQLRDKYPDKFKETFEAMLKTDDSPESIINNGLPEKVFNPYVEALYWLALDGKVSDAESVVNEYLPSKLLIFAWAKPGNNEKEKQIHKERWGKLKIVMDRLGTAPLALDCYLDTIKYVGGYTNTPREVFKKQEAHCISAAYFGEEALSKHGGFTTFMRHVAWGPWSTHDHCGLGIVLNDKRFLLVVDFNKARNSISGPYNDISEVDNRLARGKKIIERMWGSYFKPGF